MLQMRVAAGLGTDSGRRVRVLVLGGLALVADRGSWFYFVDLRLSKHLWGWSVLTAVGPARDFPVVPAVSDR